MFDSAQNSNGLQILKRWHYLFKLRPLKLNKRNFMKFSLEFFKKIDVQVLTTIDNIRIADLRRNISRVKASQDVTSPSTYVQHICQSHFFLCYLFVTYTAMTSHFIGLRSLQLTARRSGYLLFSRISYFNNKKKDAATLPICLFQTFVFTRPIYIEYNNLMQPEGMGEEQ